VAVLYISEFARVAQQIGNPVQVASQPSLADQAVAIGGASTPSAAFQPTTRFVMLSADSVCSVAFGVNPTATNTGANASMRIPANVPLAFEVPVGAGFKVGVISNT
jgi:hypothetical protein